jgi:hypothetical protein
MPGQGHLGLSIYIMPHVGYLTFVKLPLRRIYIIIYGLIWINIVAYISYFGLLLIILLTHFL